MNKYHTTVNERNILVERRTDNMFSVESSPTNISLIDVSSQVKIISENGKNIECLLIKYSEDELIYFIEGNYYNCSVISDLEHLIQKLSVSANQVQKKCIHSPMPGLLSKIFVKVGETVQEGDPIFELEAMKMKNIVKADVGGIVEDIAFDVGETVEKGSIIISLDK